MSDKRQHASNCDLYWKAPELKPRCTCGAVSDERDRAIEACRQWREGTQDLLAFVLAQRAEARREEREACCKDVCVECSVGRPIKEIAPERWEHTYKEGGDILLPAGWCGATQIRRRALLDKEPMR